MKRRLVIFSAFGMSCFFAVESLQSQIASLSHGSGKSVVFYNDNSIKMKCIKISFIFLILLNTSCREVYSPTIDEAEKTLVVEGLITDEAIAHTIRISNAAPFKSDAYFPEQGAKVTVTDNSGVSYTFTESSPGTYVSDPRTFVPENGSTYTLVIVTGTSIIYKSSPQTLYPKGTQDSVNFAVKSQFFPTYVGKNLRLVEYKGIEFLTQLDLNSDNSPYYRFSNTSLIEYTEYLELFYDTTKDYTRYPYYCWRKYLPNEFLNLNDRTYNNSTQNQHTLGFCPVDSFFYGIISQPIVNDHHPPDTIGWFWRTPHAHVITFKRYHLNKDVYKFYKAINVQLEAKQRHFDPISFQCRGNITCLNNPDKPVLGVFEVSSVSKQTYIFGTTISSENYVKVKKNSAIELDKIPISDCQQIAIPGFWTSIN